MGSAGMFIRKANLAARSSAAYVLLAGAILFFMPQAAFSRSKPRPTFAGAYLSHMGKNGPSMNVSLGDNATATVTEDPGTGPVTLFGYWTDDGGGVKVTFYPADGKPAAPSMVFQPTHDGLQAVTWDHSLWGKTTPPPMKRASGIKSKYWFTTVR